MNAPRSLVRGLEILERLQQQSEGLAFSEIARALEISEGLAKPTGRTRSSLRSDSQRSRMVDGLNSIRIRLDRFFQMTVQPIA